MDAKRVEAVEKVVLRRAEIARVSRQLQNRLALASYKTKRGWENLDLDSIEPRIAKEVEQQRLRTSSARTNDSSAPSIHRQNFVPSSFSSPIKPPPLSHSHSYSKPKSSSARRSKGTSHPAYLSPADRKRTRTFSDDAKQFVQANYTAWRSGSPGDDDDDVFIVASPSYPAGLRLSQSSPVYPGSRYQPFEPPVLPAPAAAAAVFHPPPLQKMANGTSPSKKHSRQVSSAAKHHRRNQSSVASTASTVSAENYNPHSFKIEKLAKNRHNASTNGNNNSNRASSPPRTPPRKFAPKAHASQGHGGEEGADLLMYLATSPSPAQRFAFASNNTTPASAQHQLPPPSVLSTPPSQTRSIPFGTPVLGGTGPQTPSQGFNFSDYVNIFTPSPAQTQWHPRTPIITPARRRLNFDQPDSAAIMQTSVSANTAPRRAGESEQFGNVMEVGGALMPQ
ncbi:uncharacterized protein V2V93DRAFT_375147 [Kockiozyma suomiensis]|uniref:uncharacterized protein n=1 Tax=Kockiozyma suomiensis TaxID=1337062 RepID=UPI00334383CF